MDKRPAPHIGRLIREGERSFSFEFFPPKDEAGEEQLWQAIRDLEPYRPTFVSVTYGAGGTTRDTTVEITGRIARETSMVPMGHLTCVGHTRAELEGILDSFEAAGVSNVLALRGDPKEGPRAEWIPTEGGFTYARELVELATGRFSVGVAAHPGGHPSGHSFDHDIEILRDKQAAGAEFAITDMVFRTSDYVTLVERISVHEGDPAALRAEGIAMAAELCESLLAAGAPGLHFYTLNRSKATREIFAALRITV